MAVKSDIDGFLFLELRGKLGLSGGMGRIACGWNRNGNGDTFTGTYRRDKRLKTGKVILMRSSRPTNPRSEAQTVRRDHFKIGVTNWHYLSASEKQQYNKRARGRFRTGFLLFMQEHMKEL